MIGCLIAVGVLFAILLFLWFVVLPRAIAYVQMLQTQMQNSSQSYQSSTTSGPDDGARFANGLPPPGASTSSLPPCPADYTPPAPPLGESPAPTCDASLPPGPPSGGP